MGPDFGDDELEEGIHNLGAQQHQHPCGRGSSQEWLPLIMFPGVLQLPPSRPQETPRPAGRFAQAPFKLVLLPWVPECEIVCPLRVMEKEMATHSSILAWRIPWTEKPGGLVRGVAKSQSRLSNCHITFKGCLYFPQSCGTPETKPLWPSKSNALQTHLPSAGTPVRTSAM